MNRQQLVGEILRKQSFLCVGLDPDMDKLPDAVRQDANPIFAFNRAIIDATAPFCVAYKPNLAFYECYGLAGMAALEKTIQYLHTSHPHHFIIADAKRGDIGNTSAMYAKALFDGLDVDAATVAPYMGEDSVKPFLDHKDKWTIVLALTSNRGSHDFQLFESATGERLFERVLRQCSQWADADRMMFVVGATQARMLQDIRKIVPDHFLLVPGVGAQGGSLEEVCAYGMNKDCGLLVNSSRGILYAGHGADYADAAARQAQALQSQMAAELRKMFSKGT